MRQAGLQFRDVLPLPAGSAERRLPQKARSQQADKWIQPHQHQQGRYYRREGAGFECL